jgi:hypothetical protein
MRRIMTPKKLQLLSFVMELSDSEISTRADCNRVTLSQSRKRYGLFPKSKKGINPPRCPRCGARTRLIHDEGLAFCSNCLARVNTRGEIVNEHLEVVVFKKHSYLEAS